MNLFKNIDCAIFDLDGTLIKSVRAWRHVDACFMEKRNLPIPDDFYDKVTVMNLSQAADYVIAECGVKNTHDEVIAEWLAMLEYEYSQLIPMVEGAYEFLTALHRSGIKIALATASRPELYRPCLERHRLLQLFDAFVTTDEVERQKGHPDVYLLAAKKVGALPERCAVFEDIYPGCVGAKAANMYCVGVVSEHMNEDLSDIRRICDLVIKDYTELL